MTAYYNEIDPGAAAWLRELIAGGHIAPGVVDERDIRDIRPDELRDFDQCHFFAGIGGWSLALRMAGWPDDRPVWTGSCPCQPFSAAGKRGGVDDERHLWPHWFHLIGECAPAIVFGEQVASKDGLGWLDLVCADLEGSGYAIGAADLCVAGIGGPHIRQRLWFGAERLADTLGQRGRGGQSGREDAGHAWLAGETGQLAGGLAYSDGRDTSAARQQPGREHGQQPSDGRAVGGLEHASGDGRGERRAEPSRGSLASGRGLCGLADATSGGHQPRERDARVCDADLGEGTATVQRGAVRAPVAASASSPLHGFWRDADWLWCRDGKWRPVEPGTFPLAHGIPGRVGLLRGYGNAISPPVAAEFIQAFEEARVTQAPATDLFGWAAQ